MQRKDDTAEVLKSRLEAFHRQTEPVGFHHQIKTLAAPSIIYLCASLCVLCISTYDGLKRYVLKGENVKYKLRSI